MIQINYISHKDIKWNLLLKEILETDHFFYPENLVIIVYWVCLLILRITIENGPY